MTTQDYLNASKKLNEFSMIVRVHLMREFLEFKPQRYIGGIDPYGELRYYPIHVYDSEERYRELIETH